MPGAAVLHLPPATGPSLPARWGIIQLLAATVAGWVFSETDAETEFGEQGVNERLMPLKRRERKQD